MIKEYNKTEEAIKNALENPNYTSNLFRFPGGSVGGEYLQGKGYAFKNMYDLIDAEE